MRSHAWVQPPAKWIGWAIIIGVVVTAMIVSGGQPDRALAGLNVLIALLTFSKMARSNLMPEGHGVAPMHRKLLGIPLPMAATYLIVLLLIGIVGMSMPTFEASTNLTFKLLSLCALCGWIGGIAHWFLYASPKIYYLNEAAELQRARAKGWDNERVRQHIESLRLEGFLGPPKT